MMSPSGSAPRPPAVIGVILHAHERDALAAALTKARLPADDLREPGRRFWRFETADGLPVGFGGLQGLGSDVLLRSVVTLPQLRSRGYGKAIVAALEVEARLLGCRHLWLLATQSADFFRRLGYEPRPRTDAPESIRSTAQFAALCPQSATVLMKPLR